VNANHNFGLVSIRRDADRALVRIKLTRVDFTSDEFYIRLATDLMSYVHHNGTDLLMGDVDFLIKNENKRFFLNADRSISPKTDPKKVIGVNENDPNMMLCLLDQNTDLGRSNKILFQSLATVPEYIDFKREFLLGSNKVILLQLRDRIGYANSLKYATDMGGRLLRQSEVKNLLAQVNAPLCPYKEMWISTAYDKWIHVGSYCASLRYKVGIRISKNNEKDYDIY